MTAIAQETESTQSLALKKFRLEVFAATWFSYAGFYVCRKVINVVKGPLKETLAVNDQQIAHLTTAYLVSYALGQFLTAFLSQRVSSRRLLLVGMGVATLCNLAI